MVIFLARHPQTGSATRRREGNRCEKKGKFIQGVFPEIKRTLLIK